jgi:hypothetical protein
VLVPPAFAWAGAGYELLLADCDPVDCGDRARGWFLLVMITAPLIPLGGYLVAPSVPRGAIAQLGRLACLLVGGVLMLLGLGLLAVGVGALVDYVNRDYPVNLDDPEGSRRGALLEVAIWTAGALWCFGLALLVLLVRRLLSRRYPSWSWPRSDRSTSAG